MTMNLKINTRFKYSQLTGVQRYAFESIKRMSIPYQEVAPRKSLGGISSHLWEQIILPSSIHKDDLLWSPANTSPMFIKRQVVTIHDATVLDHPEWFKSSFAIYYNLMWKKITQNAEYIITDSNFSLDSLIKFYPHVRKKIITIPLGVDAKFMGVTEQKEIEAKVKYGLPNRYVLSLGSLESRKNLKSLFHAWEAWEDRPVDLLLVVAGGRGKNFSGLGFDKIPSGIQLIGRVEDEYLPGLYSGASVFVFPSFYEGFGLPPLEAMAVGTPVICSNTSSLPEVMGSACLYIDPAKPHTILSAMRGLIFDEQLQYELADAGKERAKQFSWEKTVKITEQILQKAME
ncbi:glycosyltransferase family 4 protein [Deinococcus sp.]|uniref:glycosyltransferase family 4 protein n=1 Tax=Deinococcus sp. TaxID=47478 RepID=UPI003CC68FC0